MTLQSLRDKQSNQIRPLPGWKFSETWSWGAGGSKVKGQLTWITLPQKSKLKL